MKYFKLILIFCIVIVLILITVKYSSNLKNNQLIFDTSKCVLKNYPSGDIYRCPGSSLLAFSEIVINDTMTKRKCTISYDATKGFSFKKDKQFISIASKDIEITKNKNGDIVSVGAVADSLISLYLDENRVVHKVVVVAKDYTVEQCLNATK